MAVVEIYTIIRTLGDFEFARVPVRGDFITLPNGNYEVVKVTLWYTGVTRVKVEYRGE